MSGTPIESLFKDDIITVVTFSTKEAAFALPLDQIRYIEQDVKRNIQVGELKQFNHEAITYQNEAVPLYDFSKMIGSISLMEESKQLIKMLKDWEQEHIDWLDILEESIRENAPFTLAINPTKCAFSIWYTNFESTDADLKEVLLKFDSPHKHLHQRAKELIKLAENNLSAALEKLIIERQTTWMQLSKLFEITRERITSSIRPIIVFVEQNNQKISALRLDKIQDIESYSIKQFSKDLSTEGIMKKNQNDFVIEGFLRAGDQPPYMLINCQPQNRQQG